MTAHSEAAQEPIRLGLIGTGLAVKRLHWPALRKLRERYTIAAFCDRSRDAAARFAGDAGLPMDRYVADHQQLLARDDVEAVLITVPIPFLYQTAKDALEAGKHVICEKPPGVDEAQALQFVALGERFPDRVLLLAENMFYRDDLRLARRLLDGGAIGRLHLMGWRYAGQLIPREGQFSGTPWRQRPQYRGGALLDNGVHHVARIRLLCGDVTRVAALTQRANETIDAPSDLALTMEFASGAIGSYAASYKELPVPPEPNETRLYGTEGVLVLAGEQRTFTVTLHRPDVVPEVHRFSGIDNGYWAELRNFYEAVRCGAAIVGTVQQSVKNLLVVMRALDSAAQHQMLGVDAPALSAPPGVPFWTPHGTEDWHEGAPGEYVIERGER
ncbi:MAG: Gfo/Idh/MocA family oxidoreductase [Candidatus Dormiibacterota bacterium]